MSRFIIVSLFIVLSPNTYTSQINPFACSAGKEYLANLHSNHPKKTCLQSEQISYANAIRERIALLIDIQNQPAYDTLHRETINILITDYLEDIERLLQCSSQLSSPLPQVQAYFTDTFFTNVTSMRLCVSNPIHMRLCVSNPIHMRICTLLKAYLPDIYQAYISKIYQSAPLLFSIKGSVSSSSTYTSTPDELNRAQVSKALAHRAIHYAAESNSICLELFVNDLPWHDHEEILPALDILIKRITIERPDLIHWVDSLISRYQASGQPSKILNHLELWLIYLLDSKNIETSFDGKAQPVKLEPYMRNKLEKMLSTISHKARPNSVRERVWNTYTACAASKQPHEIIKTLIELHTNAQFDIEYDALRMAVEDFLEVPQDHELTLPSEPPATYPHYRTKLIQHLEAACLSSFTHKKLLYRCITHITNAENEFCSDDEDQKHVHALLAAYITSPVVPANKKYDALEIYHSRTGTTNLGIDAAVMLDPDTTHDTAAKQFNTYYHALLDVRNMQLTLDARHNAATKLKQSERGTELAQRIIDKIALPL